MPIVWTHADGSVEVTYLVESWLQGQRQGQEPIADTVARVAGEIQAKAPHLKDCAMNLVTSANMPTDRTERDKWRLDGGKVLVPGKLPPEGPKGPIRPEKPIELPKLPQ